MTVAEIILFVAVGYAFYRALNPLQRRLEHTLVRWFRGKRAHKPVIDITDYKKK